MSVYICRKCGGQDLSRLSEREFYVLLLSLAAVAFGGFASGNNKVCRCTEPDFITQDEAVKIAREDMVSAMRGSEDAK